MRRAVLLAVASVLAVGGVVLLRARRPAAPCAPPGPAWPMPHAGVVYGPPARPTGGEIVVGLVVPSPAPARLVDLTPPGAFDAFLRAEAALGDDEAAPAKELEFEHGPAIRARCDAAGRRRAAIEAVEQRVLAACGVRASLREVVAADASRLALVVAQDRIASDADLDALVAARAGGTRVLCVVDGPPALGGTASGVSLASADAVGPLVAHVVDAVRTSPRLRRLDADPLEPVAVRREGADVVLAWPDAAVRATLVDGDGREVVGARRGPDGVQRLRCPDPGLDPATHVVVASLDVGGVGLRRATSVLALVGTVERTVVAPAVAEAGAAYAPRVVFTGSRDGGPAPGRPCHLALVRGDRTLAERDATSGPLGALDVHLDVPADAAPGPAELVVDGDRFAVAIVTGLRVSVATDRPLYRPTDEVRVRVLVHRAARGEPVADADVTLRLRDAEKHVRTSAHGVASTTFTLVDAPVGPGVVFASVADAEARAPLRVRAFEVPTYVLTLAPASLALRAGEAAPLAVEARYVNGEPVVGAAVRATASDDAPTPVPSTTTTDAQGRAAVVVRARADGAAHTVRVAVQDADGRVVERAVEVTVADAGPVATLDLVPIEDPVVGLPGRFEVSRTGDAPVDGPAEVVWPDGTTSSVRLGADGRATVAWTPTTARGEAALSGAGASPARADVVAVERDAARLLVRPTRRAASVGETLDVELFGPDGVATVELARDRTVLRTRRVRVEAGVARASFPLDADLGGVLAVRALVGDDAEAKGGSTSVLVSRGRSLRVVATPSAEAWRPGETATVDVTVADRAGRPTAAVLGYWGVDEALLALAPAADPAEDAFDAMPARPSEGAAVCAADGERGRAPRFVALRDALGPVSRLDRVADPVVVHRSATRRDADARAWHERRFEASVHAARAAVVAALAATPPQDVRVHGSVLGLLRALVASGRLAPDVVRDPWGTPVAVGRDVECFTSEGGDRSDASRTWSWSIGVGWRSAGPDLVFGTGDDLAHAWSPIEPWEVDGPTGRWLHFVAVHPAWHPRAFSAMPHVGGGEGFAACEYDLPFEGPVNHGLIGLGGGAGGAFRGLGGHRNLRAGGGGARASMDAEPPVVVRRDFAPTLCFVPEAIVGPDGRARLEVPLKDSITTWRLRLVASASDGATGVGEARLRSTQPLSADPWVAPHVTVGDVVELPVTVRNETAEAVETVVAVTASAELVVEGRPTASVAVGPGGTAAHVVVLRAVAPGTARVRVDASHAAARDAVERVVVVHRDARAVVETAHGTLGDGPTWLAALPAAPPDRAFTQRAVFYPSPVADLVGGFEGLIACPHG